MPDTLPYDVFLSHSSKDKDIVRAVAKRLRADGLSVWFDEWVLKPGDNLLKKLDDGLEESRVLVLCMSANAFGSDWSQLKIAQGDKEKARAHLTTAKEKIERMGYHRRYKEVNEIAAQLSCEQISR